jgi:glycosidase
MPGVPSIYYGSEWGLLGKRAHGDDSPVRPAIDLAAGPSLGAEPALADAIRRLAAVRSGSAALRRGSYRQLHAAAEQFAFARELDGEAVVVLLNASEREVDLAVPAPRDGEWHDMLNGGTVGAAGGRLRAAVPAGWGRVLRAGQPAGPT